MALSFPNDETEGRDEMVRGPWQGQPEGSDRKRGGRAQPSETKHRVALLHF